MPQTQQHGGTSEYRTPAKRIIERCRELAQISDVPGQTTRTFLSSATRKAHELLSGWMREAGLTVGTDAIGNLRGFLPAQSPRAPRILIGSHIDTVPDAGAFDGPLGVLLGLALIEQAARNPPLPYAIEVVAFSEEEGVRFAVPFLGSLALIGQFDRELLTRIDPHGTSLEQAIRHFGLDPGQLPAAVADPDTRAYLEFHIEQGPVLESQERSIGVVEAIAGQSRLALTFSGRSNHAGTTPMGPLRRDALAAAAEWIVEVEHYALAIPGLVATVGRLDGSSTAGNVITGQAVATLDVRHASDNVRHTAVQHLLSAANDAGGRRGVAVSHTATLDQSAVPMDTHLTKLLSDAAQRATGKPPAVLVSGAGHDAMIVARRIPAAMLFLRSPGGISHNPSESVLLEDVEAAFATGVELLQALRFDP